MRVTRKPKKVILLYGYLPFGSDKNSAESKRITIRNGQDAGEILLQTIRHLDGIDNDDNVTVDAGENSGSSPSSFYKINRSYGFFSRSADCVQQDTDTGAITEVMAVKLHPLPVGVSVDDWLDQVQRKLA